MFVTVGQFAAGTDTAANVAAATGLIERAAARGTGMVVLPEMAQYYDPDPDAHRDAVAAHAESIDGPFAAAMSAAAAEAGVAVVAGMTESPSGAAPSKGSTSGDDRCSNTVLAFGEDGERIGLYRKVHLYDAFGFRESDRIVPHPPVPLVFERDGLTFGVLTCYDLRFPEMARVLVDAGAQVLVLPAAWAAGPAKEDHWETLIRARAIENTVYAVASGQTGPACTGRSMIVDPAGAVVASAGEAPGFVTGWIDRDRVDAVRRRDPSLQNRRFGVDFRG